MSDNEGLSKLGGTLKLAVATLRDAQLPFALGGSVAAWARGGPASENDLDLMVKPSDAEAALGALEAAGLRTERPPEEWLYKAWDGEVLVDLIFRPSGLEIDDDVLGRADTLSVLAVATPVMQLEDVLTTKLMAFDEHSVDYTSLLQIVRAVREQVDWPELRRRTAGSPFADAFFTLAAGLRIAPAQEPAPAPRVRVLGTPER